jgi:tetratricopeptide (TPR) repeat protein
LRLKSLFILSFLFFSICTNAHGDLHKRILKVTEEIKKNPDSANLYFKRGKLYYQHSNYTNSLKDFDASKTLGFNNFEQDLLVAKSNYHLNKFRESKIIIKNILRDRPENVDALRLLADIYFKKKKFKKSAKLYQSVIQYSKKTRPEHYLYASKAWFATNSKSGFEFSQQILIEGIEKLGDVIVLYDKLVSNYVDIKDFDSALRFQSKVIEISNRKERAYLKLANIQIQQEKFKEAEISIEKSEASYKKLPHRIRNTKFMKDFYSELQSKKLSLKK